MADIQVNGKPKFLGYFDEETDAARAYDRAAKKYHRQYATLNFNDKRRMSLLRKKGPKIKTTDSSLRWNEGFD